MRILKANGLTQILCHVLNQFLALDQLIDPSSLLLRREPSRCCCLATLYLGVAPGVELALLDQVVVVFQVRPLLVLGVVG